MSYKHILASASAAALLLGASSANAAFIGVVGNNSIDGSLCVGFDCIANESFGFDTIRMKENNVRLHYDDTSTSASFPNNDWRIEINDSANGGSNHYAIQDATAGRNVVLIEAGAPANSVRVDSGGRLGVTEDNPAVSVHITDGNSPTVRLEQDGSDGFTPQTWDMAGNEANFFIRDVTHGSALPFRIQPDADSNAIYIESTNDIGFGTTNPTSTLHVVRTDGGADAFIQENSSTVSNRDMLTLENNGRPRIVLVNDRTDNPALAGEWAISGGDTFVVQERIRVTTATTGATAGKD